jgi:ribosome maturation factor RimP
MMNNTMEKTGAFEEKLSSILAAPLESEGYEIVLVRLSRSNKLTVELLLERLDRKAITVGDCGQASKLASTILDVEDIISENYNLEVSSPGADRPLIKAKDFERFQNRWVVIKTKIPVGETRKFKGKNLGINNNTVLLALPGGERVEIDYSNILNAKLFLSDEEFRKILKDKKKQEKNNK